MLRGEVTGTGHQRRQILWNIGMGKVQIPSFYSTETKVVQNSYGVHPSCTSYKLGYLGKTAITSPTLFTLQQNEENNNKVLVQRK